MPEEPCRSRQNEHFLSGSALLAVALTHKLMGQILVVDILKYFSYSPHEIGDSLHEMSNPMHYVKNKKTNPSLSSAGYR